MFSIQRWFKSWRNPVIVLVEGVDTQELTKRIQNRLLAMDEGSLEGLREIVAEEALAQSQISALRSVMETREHIDMLPPRQRAMLLDHVDHNLTYHEIARNRGLTERIVLKDLTRAYSTLRMRMLKDERNRSPVSGDSDPTNAALRPASDGMGQHSGVHNDRTTDGVVSSSTPGERPPSGGPKS